MQINSDDVYQFLTSALFVLPFIVVHFVGVVLSILLRGRIGKPWLFSLAGFLFLTLTSVIQLAYFVWLYFLFDKARFDSASMVLAGQINSISQGVAGLLGIVCIMMAIFLRPRTEPVKAV